ncbi:titin-like [Polypterus senegalus]|nr:titin-like [Polypterus senegalus]
MISIKNCVLLTLIACDVLPGSFPWAKGDDRCLPAGTNTHKGNFFQEPKEFFMEDDDQMNVFTGDFVTLHISRNPFEVIDLTWKKDGAMVARFKNDMKTVSSKSNAQMLSNGTLRLGRISVNDHGTYSVEVYDKDGRNVKKDSRFLDVFDKTQLAALGAPLALHPKNEMSGMASIEWKKGDVLLGWQNITHNEKCYNRMEIFQNGTLWLEKTEKADEGIYTVNVFDENGSPIYTELIKVIAIELPSMPVLNYSCHTTGEIIFECSINEDSEASFKWVLDGEMLNEEKNNTTKVNNTNKGVMQCIVSNIVGSSKSEIYFSCPGKLFLTLWYIIASIIAAVLLSIICLSLIFCKSTHKKKHNLPAPSMEFLGNFQDLQDHCTVDEEPTANHSDQYFETNEVQDLPDPPDKLMFSSTEDVQEFPEEQDLPEAPDFDNSFYMVEEQDFQDPEGENLPDYIPSDESQQEEQKPSEGSDSSDFIHEQCSIVRYTTIKFKTFRCDKAEDSAIQENE